MESRVPPIPRTPSPAVLCAAIAWVGVLGGCLHGGPGGADGGSDAGSAQTACVVDTDCPDPTLFVCSSNSFKCEPSCHVASDCGADHRGAFPLAYCAGPLGCQCDQGECVKALCSADPDC